MTNSTGHAPINIFKAINADSTTMCASFALKPTATHLKRVLMRNWQGCLVGWRRKGMLVARRSLLFIFCKCLPCHPPDGYPFWPFLWIHLHCSYTEQWVQFFPNSESVIRGKMASLDIVLFKLIVFYELILAHLCTAKPLQCRHRRDRGVVLWRYRVYMYMRFGPS